jgi:ribosomal protein S18 acetylase RimI-like enzyme
MEQITIRPFQESDLVEAVVVTTRAYDTNPLGDAVYRGHPEKLRFQEASNRQILARAPGQVFIAEKGGKVIGMMRMTEWPQCQITLSFFQTLRIIVPALLSRNRGVVLRRMAARSVWTRHHPNKPHWHLGPIAVIPELQRRGIGSQLLEHFCRIVDQSGQAAYLETDKPENVCLYERFGFQVIEEGPVVGIPNWFMWRPPRPPATPKT